MDSFIGALISVLVVVVVAVSTTVSSALTFFGRPRFRGAGLSCSTFSTAFTRDEWNC